MTAAEEAPGTRLAGAAVGHSPEAVRADDLERACCAICGRDDAVVYIRGDDGCHLVKCRHDGLVYASPRPSFASVRDRLRNHVADVDTYAVLRADALAREAALIKSMKADGALLDVGCSVGTLFAYFDPSQWRLYGIDVSSFNARQAASRHGVDVRCGVLQEAEFSAGVFDVITVIDTIPLIHDPSGDLQEIDRCLKPDGLLAIEIPGFVYWLFRNWGPVCWLIDRRWSRFSVRSGRLYCYSRRTLTGLLETHGFRVVTIVPEQAISGGTGVRRLANQLHFALARLLFRASFGRVSIAAREFYVACKIEDGDGRRRFG